MEVPEDSTRGDYVALAGSSSSSSSSSSPNNFSHHARLTTSSNNVTPGEEIQDKSGEGGGGRDSGGGDEDYSRRGSLNLNDENSEMAGDHCNTHNVDLPHGPSALALPRPAILVYGTGHVLNDLTAACWFTYLLIFLTDVGLSPKQAGAVMLSGQVADAFATILVGQLIDRFGQFKMWHAGGSLLVAVSFSSVFGGCIACEIFGTNSTSAVTVGYSTFAAIFNLGWAATQVSHMSLVNCITANSSSRVSLNSCRNAFSMIANLCLYAIAYAVFWALPATSAGGVHVQFRWIAWVAILTGSCFVTIFLLGVREPKLYHHAQVSVGTFTRVTVASWFKRPLYYQVALVYMLTRLTTNVSQSFLPFYVVQDLKMGESSKAVVPALIYICSFIISVVLQELHWTGQRLKGFFTGGASLWVVSGAVIFFLPATYKLSMYGLAAVIGLGNALMLVTATSMQGVLVGHDLSGCAFVYGSLSFLDKLACGLALYFLERLNVETSPCRQASGSVGVCSDSLIRLALGLVPSGCALMAAVITSSMNLTDTSLEASSLRRPSRNKIEPSTKDKGSKSPAGNTRAAARPILTPRSGSTRRNRSSVEETDDDIEKSSTGGESPFTFWKRLESAMVGRWGSIRKPPQTWLE
ncbi:unnamed protein product [Calypogeia fissa]